MWRTTGMLVTAASCVFVYVTTPYYECLAGKVCDDLRMGSLTWMYSRSVSVTCLVSSAVVFAKYRRGKANYGSWIALHDAYSPTTDVDRHEYAAFNAAVLCACMAFIVPANATRLFGFLDDRRMAGVVEFFVQMYAQNALTCLIEMRFVLLCYVLYTKFSRINRDAEAVGEQIAADCGVRPQGERQDRGDRYWILDDSDMYRSRATGQLLVDAIEQLKIRHRLVREAVDELHGVFAVPIGFSLCNLCIMALYDIYYQLLNVYVQHTVELSNLYVFVWLVQYLFRFFIIVIMVHSTMQQALKMEESLMYVSRNCLDVYTKEELKIFSDQVSSIMEFSICGLFTLNSQLFTSAMGVSTSYLVILLQLKSKLDNEGL